MVTSVKHLERVEWNLSQFHYSRLFGTSTYAFNAKMCKMQDSEMPFESFMSGWFEKKKNPAHANFLLDLFFNFSSDVPDVACAGSIFPLQ